MDNLIEEIDGIILAKYEELKKSSSTFSCLKEKIINIERDLNWTNKEEYKYITNKMFSLLETDMLISRIFINK